MDWLDDYKASLEQQEEAETTEDLYAELEKAREEYLKQKREQFLEDYFYLDERLKEKVEDKDERFSIISLFFGGLV